MTIFDEPKVQEVIHYKMNFTSKQLEKAISFEKIQKSDVLKDYEKKEKYKSDKDIFLIKENTKFDPLKRLKAAKTIQKLFRGNQIRKKFFHIISLQLEDFREHRLLKKQIKNMENTINDFKINSYYLNNALYKIRRSWKAYKLNKEINKRIAKSKIKKENEQSELKLLLSIKQYKKKSKKMLKVSPRGKIKNMRGSVINIMTSNRALKHLSKRSLTSVTNLSGISSISKISSNKRKNKRKTQIIHKHTQIIALKPNQIDILNIPQNLNLEEVHSEIAEDQEISNSEKSVSEQPFDSIAEQIYEASEATITNAAIRDAKIEISSFGQKLNERGMRLKTTMGKDMFHEIESDS
mmetsp:Transcript_6300/g.5415  ORF Transcript_6300/g.5415 Transcript_6300/m.5415 type:complete len:351 (+) Transcript_6300:657-1709(+)